MKVSKLKLKIIWDAKNINEVVSIITLLNPAFQEGVGLVGLCQAIICGLKKDGEITHYHRGVSRKFSPEEVLELNKKLRMNVPRTSEVRIIDIYPVEIILT